MIRNLGRHLWESLKNIRRNGWMTVAAVSSVTITLVLMGTFLSVIFNTQHLATEIANNVRVVSYLNLNVNDNQETINKTTTVKGKTTTKAIKNPNYHKIYDQIKAIPNVQKITFSSKDEQLKELEASLGSSWSLFKGDANPLYNAYVVEADSSTHVISVSKEIAKVSGVMKVNYGGANTKKIFDIAKFIRTWGSILALLLMLVAVLLISNTIRITIISRQREIQIMRLVGAKNGYIRWPFFLEGAWVGLIGAIIPSVLLVWLYRLVYVSFMPSLAAQRLSIISPDSFIPMIVGAMFVTGVLIGSLGAVISMRRFLKA